MNRPVKYTKVIVRKFVRPMRDTQAAVESIIREIEVLNNLQEGSFLYEDRNTIFIPVDFSGLYQADTSDVIKTEHMGRYCLVVTSFIYTTEVPLDLATVLVPENSGVVSITTQECVNFDSEPT